MVTGQPSTVQWQQAARCGDRLEGVKDVVLQRCGISAKTYSEYAIEQERSVDRVRAEIRCSEYLSKPMDSVQFLHGMSGEYLHPDFVNYDMTVKSNMAAFKSQLCGKTAQQMKKVHILADDDCVDKMTKAELIQHLMAAISANYTGDERDLRLSAITRVKTKAGLVALLQETAGADERGGSEKAEGPLGLMSVKAEGPRWLMSEKADGSRGLMQKRNFAKIVVFVTVILGPFF